MIEFADVPEIISTIRFPETQKTVKFMRTTLSFHQKSDFLTDLTDAFFRLPETLIRSGVTSLRLLVRTVAQGARWLRSDRGQLALIILSAATVLGLQLRSML